LVSTLTTETLNQLDDILNHYLPNHQAKAIEQLLNLKTQEEEITAIERQLAAAAAPEAYEKLADAVRYSQAELVQAKAAYETARRRCDELATLIDKTKKELSQYSEQNIDRKMMSILLKHRQKSKTRSSFFVSD
jgi:DNA sulfur modification protein DndD